MMCLTDFISKCLIIIIHIAHFDSLCYYFKLTKYNNNQNQGVNYQTHKHCNYKQYTHDSCRSIYKEDRFTYLQTDQRCEINPMYKKG